MLAKKTAQNSASNPNYSCWVEASAGTGKTKVLIDRILRLLLYKVDPKNILCITFTKAASTEMSERLYKKLQDWSFLESFELEKELFFLTEKNPDNDLVNYAKSLLIKVIDNPVGIQTIHSFCQNLLQIFPIEAGIYPNFSIIDDTGQKNIFEQVIENITNDEDNQKILEVIFEIYSCDKIIDLCIKLPRKFLSLDVDYYKSLLSKKLNINHENNHLIEKKICHEIETQLLNFCNLHDIEKANNINNFLKNKDLSVLQKIFLTEKKEIRKKIFKSELIKKFPDKEIVAQKIAVSILEFLENLLNIEIFEKSSYFFEFWHIFQKEYTKIKSEKNFLDYEDIITKTVDLLKDEQMNAWVTTKVGQKIKHILVDEAQDTNQEQWSVIKSLLHDIDQTIMVVGDNKQSIYSFQGVDDKSFFNAKKYFKEQIENLKEIDLDISFRSSPAILDLVDKFIEIEKKGINDNNFDKKIIHHPHRKQSNGKVVLWDFIEKNQIPELDPWFIPQQNFSSKDDKKLFADFVAEKVYNLLQNKRKLDCTNNFIQPKDILILTRNRSNFVNYLIKSLKNQNLPVSSRDRISLKDELLVLDLLSIAKFINLPRDDYNLACLLKSPIVNNGKGIDEKLLFELCYYKKKFLWDEIREKAENDHFIKTIFLDLQKILDMSKHLKICDFYQEILLKNKDFFVKRLGEESIDLIDNFLEIVYQFHNFHPSSWFLFLNYWKELDIEVKKESDSKTNQVRVMTVHGSKGLQSPVVIFADEDNKPTLRQEDFLFDENLFFLRPSDKQSNQVTKKLKALHLDKMEQEHRRLLYVMMTRSQDELYIARQKTNNTNSWSSLIENTLSKLDSKKVDGSTFYEKNYFNFDVDDINISLEEKQKAFNYPNLFDKSIPSNSNSYSFNKNKIYTESLKFGTLIHELLEILSYTAKENWNNLILDYEKKHNLPKNYSKKILNLLNNKKFEIFFKQPCLSEINVVHEGKFKGRIDRISIHDPYVYLLDFKTGTKNELSYKSYLEQLDFYAKFLQQIYPNFTVIKHILWIDDLKLEIL